ncbi:vacuolar ATPase assembly integral membrane protein VMA21-like isoform X1 [Ptychodera flava]|uniref:vacuolar ATPase assembly integral membrane protein VMA21-like isoform X1 n=1 Tax=Ptychodera flava TaxID=63121 RepID=UPI00396AAF8A
MADIQDDQTFAAMNRRSDEQLSDVLKTMLGYSLMIIFLPLISYFVSKNMIFEGIFMMSNRDALFYGGITAVVVVHIILAAFIYTAWNEDRQKPKPVKSD